MKGRVENDNKRNCVVIRLLTNYPNYMKDYIKRFSSRTSSTKENYVRRIIEFLDYVKKDKRYDINSLESLAKIKPSYINGYMETQNYLTPGSRAGKLAAIKDFFDYLVEDEYMLMNPCDRVKPPKVEENINVISMDKTEIGHMKDRVKNGFSQETSLEKARRADWRLRDLAIVTIGCQTGLRVSSITEINMEDIDFENKTVTVVVKGNKTKEIKLGNNTINAIKEWMIQRELLLKEKNISCDALFISDRRCRISAKTVSRIVERGTSDLDKHITPHKMRSSCATNLYEATGDIYLVQNQLGHSNIKNTRRYAKVSDAKMRNAADILDNL